MTERNATEQDMDDAAAKGYIITNWRTPYSHLEPGARLLGAIQRFVEGRGVSPGLVTFMASPAVLRRYNMMAPFPILRVFRSHGMGTEHKGS